MFISPEPVSSLRHNNKYPCHKEENRKSSNNIEKEICWDDASHSLFSTVPEPNDFN